MIERGRGREVGGGGGGGQEGGNELQQSGFAIADDVGFFWLPSPKRSKSSLWFAEGSNRPAASAGILSA